MNQTSTQKNDHVSINNDGKMTNKIFRHVLPLQIRFNDVDKFGHVNNTVYFQFYDTTKTDYFASVCQNVNWEQVAIVVVKIEAEFLGQVKAGYNIAGRTRVTKIGRTSFELEQEVFDTDTHEVKSHCRSVMVLYDLIRQKPMHFPDAWRQAICRYDGLELK
jgi:acyl-CoA thioester hydrolase